MLMFVDWCLGWFSYKSDAHKAGYIILHQSTGIRLNFQYTIFHRQVV